MVVAVALELVDNSLAAAAAADIAVAARTAADTAVALEPDHKPVAAVLA